MLLLLACAQSADTPAAASAAASSAAAPPAALTLDAESVLTTAPGLELHQQTWHLDDRSGLVWTARLAANAALHLAASDDVRPLDSIVADEAGSFASINGGFYDDGPMGLVVSDGVERHAFAARGGSGVVLFDPMPIAVVHRDAWAPGPRQALQSIDRLVDGGLSLVKPKPGAHRDARSAVAVTTDGVWLIAAVAQESVHPVSDGIQLDRTVGTGLALAEFADLLVGSFHSQQALNLDGAVSTQMVVATPASRWVVHGERGTINGVVLRPR